VKLLYRCAAAVLGAILGLGCEHSLAPSEYGQPYATLKLDGIVSAADTRNPIAGIRIALRDAPEVRSDAQGRWSMHLEYCWPCGAGFDPCSLSVSDTDGPANGGAFAAASVPLHPVRTTGGAGWFEGTFEQQDVEIELTKE
jgi:putative lipoprotein (rSAM/lipoprotein system)